MKKLLALVLSLMLVLSCVSGMAEGADAFTSASVADYYGAYALSGDDLMNAINSYSGFYGLATVNPDGTPNLGFFVYGCVAKDGVYYIQLGLAPNQTVNNLQATGKGVAMYAATPSDQAYATAGARMILELVTDEALVAELYAKEGPAPMFCEIKEVKPLG